MTQRATLTNALKWFGCAAAVSLFIYQVGKADLGRTWMILQHAGPLVALCLVPYALAVAVDSLAWKQLFSALGREVRIANLMVVRLACEAVSMSLPAGSIVAESLTPALLQRHTKTPASASVAAMAGKKWLTMRAHGLYVALSVVVGFAILSRVSSVAMGGPWLPWVILALACVPAGLSVALQASLQRGSLAVRLHDLLRRLPIERLRVWLDTHKPSFASADSGFARIVARPANTRKATLLYVTAWMIESVETLVILRVLGADISFASAMSMEAGLSVVRSLAFFAPAGIGVQDLGYVAFLSAMGLPEAAALASAFLLVKRSKEIFWIVVGGAVLLFQPRLRPTKAEWTKRPTIALADS